MERAVGQVLFAGQFHQFHALFDRRGQGLFANDVLAGLERVFDHGEVQVVGGAHMHHVNLRIVQNGVVIAGGFIDVEFFAEFPRLLFLALPDGVDLDETQAADAFQVHAADEAGAEHGSLQSMDHEFLFS